MKYGVFVFALFMIACGVSQTKLPFVTETPILPTSTSLIVEVTRIVKVEQTVIVTATPLPLLSEECFKNAITQSDLNGCAAEERFLAQGDLENTILLIKGKFNFSLDDEQAFDKLQKEWEDIVERNCNFYYEKWGSMGPMQRSMCVAARIKERITELEIVYLTPDG
jgi:uncharacterized protein YecT (DUF1311 family)